MNNTFLKFLLVQVATSIACQHIYWNPFKIDDLHIAALILARGGSKSIYLKNLSNVGGTPILTTALNEILKTKGFSSVWVSTDHRAIYDEALKSNVNIHWRSEESATDNASSIFAIQEFLNYHPEIDIIGLIQCTSPFIKSKYLEEAISLVYSCGTGCVFSVTRSRKLRWAKDNDIIVPLNFKPTSRPRRQDTKGEYIENGMFYFSVKQYIKMGYLQNNSMK